MNKLGSFFDGLSGDDKLLASHIYDMAEICDKKYIPRFSSFLDARQAKLAESVLCSIGFDRYMFYGGYDEAERVILGVFPPYSEPDKTEFPMKNLVFRYRETDKLSHRDFLGSLMGCRINRNMIGDIIVNDGYTVAFVYTTVAENVCTEVRKIGSVGVNISEEAEPDIRVNKKFTEICGTVSSLRVDSVVSLAVKLSREKTAQIIRSGNVTVNYSDDVSVSDEMKEGDVFSARGYGKFLLESINGKTKKDRLHICIKKYI